NGEHVPDERTAPLWPKLHRVRDGQQPVEEPRPAHVEQRVEAGAGDREERHGFGEAVDAGPPLLVQQEQDRRYERARMADADPPHEIDDVEAPADGNVDTEDADAGEY